MKKTLLTFVLALVGSVAFCEDFIPLERKDIRTRSVVTVPEASIIGSLLTVSFDSFGLCSLYIEDSFGRTVFTSTLPADGMEYRYDLSLLGKGDFTLLIVSPEGEYEGCFGIY